MSITKDLIYLHGFAADSNATKASFLSEKLRMHPEIRFHRPNFNSSAEDFKYKTITGMIARLREYILANNLENPYIVASSLSGIVALNYAKRYNHIAGLLLLSPMTRYFRIYSEQEELEWKEEGQIKVYTYFAENTYLSYDFIIDAQNYIKNVIPLSNTKIIHGQYDQTVPFKESLRYCNSYELELITIDSGHLLKGKETFDRIWLETKNMLSLFSNYS